MWVSYMFHNGFICFMLLIFVLLCFMFYSSDWDNLVTESSVSGFNSLKAMHVDVVRQLEP